MQLRYDEDFIEAVVFLCAGGRRKGIPSLQVSRFHAERERLYAILDPDERNAAFFKLHLDWFREWGLETVLKDLLSEFRLVAEQVSLLAVRKTRSKSDEGAELYVNEAGQRSAILALRPESFLDDLTLRDYLRHEFTHLKDMVDPLFSYSPSLDLPGLNPAQKRLARERYRLLWDITIDGRLVAAGHRPTQTRDWYAASFDRAYCFWPEEKRCTAFVSLWNCDSARHADLLSLIADPRGLRGAARPAPGGSCPLCDFPTFAWADEDRLPAPLVLRVQAEFPAWQTEQGLCSRCLETYEAIANASVDPPSLVVSPAGEQQPVPEALAASRPGNSHGHVW